jgi:alanyl-tRNA synthetase
MSVDQQFTVINEKLQLLLKQHHRARKEIESLKEALEIQKKEAEATGDLVSQLKQQVAILKLAAGDMNEQDKKEFERQINQYVKQIDKCIAYLGQ